MSWFSFALSYAGVALLAFAMSAHHRRVFGSAPEPRRARTHRIAGWALLASGLAVSRIALGWQVGLVAWIAMIGVGGFALTLLLAFAPRFTLAPAAGLLLVALAVSASS